MSNAPILVVSGKLNLHSPTSRESFYHPLPLGVARKNLKNFLQNLEMEAIKNIGDPREKTDLMLLSGLNSFSFAYHNGKLKFYNFFVDERHPGRYKKFRNSTAELIPVLRLNGYIYLAPFGLSIQNADAAFEMADRKIAELEAKNPHMKQTISQDLIEGSLDIRFDSTDVRFYYALPMIELPSATVEWFAGYGHDHVIESDYLPDA